MWVFSRFGLDRPSWDRPSRDRPSPGPPFPWTGPSPGPALPLDRPFPWTGPSPGPALPLDQPFPWTAQNFALFFPSLGVFSLNFGGVFECRDPQMCTFGLSGCRVEPRRPHQTGPPGLHTTTRELQNSTKGPPRREERGRKKREILALHPSNTPPFQKKKKLRGPTFPTFGPHPSGLEDARLRPISTSEPKSKLAEVEIGRNRTDGVCSVSSFSLSCFCFCFVFLLSLLFSCSNASLSSFCFLFCFCFRPGKPELNSKPRTLHPIADGPFRTTLRRTTLRRTTLRGTTLRGTTLRRTTFRQVNTQMECTPKALTSAVPHRSPRAPKGPRRRNHLVQGQGGTEQKTSRLRNPTASAIA